MLTPRERVRRAILHQPVDHLPTQVNYTSAMADRLVAHWGITEAELSARLGNHLLRVDIDVRPRLSDDRKVRFDWWGVGFDTQEEGYFASVNPLAGARDLDAYPWPDPYAPDLFTKATAMLAADRGMHFSMCNLGFCLFERAWSLRHFSTFLMDIAADLDFAGALLDRIVEIQAVLIRRYIGLGVDGGYFGDDYGSQTSLLFSPRVWRTLIKPRLARLFEPFRAAGLPVLMHSDGNISSIIPDLIEIGLTTLNPVQPEVLDHAWLRRTFGTNLSFYGGISTQTVLPHGSSAQVRAAVSACVRELSWKNTGLIVAPSHRMMSDVPPENVDALLSAFADLTE